MERPHLIAVREQLGYTVRGMARKTHIKVATYRQLEAGEIDAEEYVATIADVIQLWPGAPKGSYLKEDADWLMEVR